MFFHLSIALSSSLVRITNALGCPVNLLWMVLLVLGFGSSIQVLKLNDLIFLGRIVGLVGCEDVTYFTLVAQHPAVAPEQKNAPLCFGR